MAEVLVIDGGGRGQAIAQAMELSPEVGRVEVRANAEAGREAFSSSKEKPFVVIGPEKPLVEGLADELRAEGYTVLGASKAAAQYEASKSRTTRLARMMDVVHPDTFIAEGTWMAEAAREYVEGHEPQNYVIKADGLAGGKGVVLPETFDEARETVEGMISGELFDGAGKEVINFSKRKKGPEVSAMVIVGRGPRDIVILPLSQDHKRLENGDQGPNTGGMGAYAPVPESIVSDAQYEKIEEKAYDLLDGMAAERVRAEGWVMYMGLMMSEDLTDDESDLIEINVRFGDPEIQAILPTLTHAGVDVYRLLRSAAEGSIEDSGFDFTNIGSAALSVCLAAYNYPDTPRKGDDIFGLDREYAGVTVQEAAVIKNANGRYITDGGRVLYVTGVGENIDIAAQRAYAAIGENAIHFADNQYRTDIGWQARKTA